MQLLGEHKSSQDNAFLTLAAELSKNTDAWAPPQDTSIQSLGAEALHLYVWKVPQVVVTHSTMKRKDLISP